MDKKIKELENELRRYNEQLKKVTGSSAANIKKRALDTLKRKRMYENQRDQLANQAFNVDQTAFAIETVKSTQSTVVAMQAAAKTLKKENKKINLSEIEDMQDDMEDMLEDVGEISDILGRSYGTPEGLDEADLEAELAGLEGEWAEEEMEAAMAPAAVEDSQQVSMPAVPGAAPTSISTPSQAVSSSAPLSTKDAISYT